MWPLKDPTNYANWTGTKNRTYVVNDPKMWWLLIYMEIWTIQGWDHFIKFMILQLGLTQAEYGWYNVQYDWWDTIY